MIVSLNRFATFYVQKNRNERNFEVVTYERMVNKLDSNVKMDVKYGKNGL